MGSIRDDGGVGGYSLGVVLTASVEVMIDPPNPRLLESVRFLFSHQTERTTNIDADFFFDLASTKAGDTASNQ